MSAQTTGCLVCASAIGGSICFAGLSVWTELRFILGFGIKASSQVEPWVAFRLAALFSSRSLMLSSEPLRATALVKDHQTLCANAACRIGHGREPTHKMKHDQQASGTGAFIAQLKQHATLA